MLKILVLLLLPLALPAAPLTQGEIDAIEVKINTEQDRCLAKVGLLRKKLDRYVQGRRFLKDLPEESNVLSPKSATLRSDAAKLP